MKARQKWVYYCDFCKKKLMVRAAMERHEKHCTMNPDRVCRMCARIEADAAPLPDLISLLPNPAEFRSQPDGRSWARSRSWPGSAR